MTVHLSNRKTYTYEEVLAASVEYFQGDELAAQVWINKYALQDSQGNLYERTPDDMHRRIARELHRIEIKYPNALSEEELYELLKDFRYIVPQGSPMAGIGNDYQVSSLSNCFVIGNPADSYGGIIRTDEEQVQLMKRRGGVGHDLSHIRPKGSPVMNSALTSTGITPFMERYSNSTREVAQGGRRGALMLTISVRHPDVEDFIDAKMEQGKVTGANVSVRIDDAFMKAAMNGRLYTLQFPIRSEDPKLIKEIDAEKLWDKIIYNAWKSAEPGVLFWDTVIRESVPDCYADLGYETISTNPCLTGDSPVAVADGRGQVPIRQLAEEGVDVPVYCLDERGHLDIQMMRNPRLSGRRQKIYKVTLDDGSVIRTTGNHKFRLQDGSYREVEKLNPGDSLMILTKFQGPVVNEEGRSQTDYWWFNEGVAAANKSEHRLIAAFHQQRAIRPGEVVHHIDYDSLNNAPDNLQIMAVEAHNELHRADMLGRKNPIFKLKADPEKLAAYSRKMSKATSGLKNGNAFDLTNEQLYEKALALTRRLGRRFSKKEWQDFARANGLPMTFSRFRRSAFGSIRAFSRMAATELGYEHTDADPRLVRSLNQARRQGYNARLNGRQVEVEKTCEGCGAPFWTNYYQREISYCSFSCLNHKLNTDAGIRAKRTESVNAAFRDKAVRKREDQLAVYTRLKFELERTPRLKEWETACREAGIPFRLKTKYGFDSWSALQSEAEFFNHRVQSVAFDGYEDVYNGTVDKHHNYFAGGWAGQTRDGKPKRVYLNQLNCGEIPLCPYDSCRLLAINLFSYVEDPFTPNARFDFEKFGRHVQYAQRIMDDIIDLEIEKIDRIIDKVAHDDEPEDIRRVELELWKKVRKTCVEDRRTGVGITAEGDMLAALGLTYGSDEAIDFSVQVHRTLAANAYRSSVTMAQERGAFPIFEAEREADNPFIRRLGEADPQLLADMREHGRRNIALLTIAPTGTTSLMTQTSSGIEPVFLVSYKRRRKVNPNDQNARVTFVDEVGDSWEEYHVFHHKFRDWLQVNGYDLDKIQELSSEELDDIIAQSPYQGATANDVDWVQKVKMQGAIQKWVDHSISVTVNIPEETTVAKVKEIYQTAWEAGCKGCTIYRDGSRSGVLVSDKDKAKQNGTAFVETMPPKRPERLEASIVRFKNNEEDWIGVIGLYEGKPYEIFTGKAEDTFRLPDYVTKGWVLKAKEEGSEMNRYDFQFMDREGYRVTIEGLSRSFDKEYWNYAKLISGVLRHGMPLPQVVNLVEGLNVENTYISTWKNGVIRALKKFIPDGTKAAKTECPHCSDPDGLVYKEGCLTCKSCGYSECG
jgi:ribonucleotide reductase alpha subunit